MNLVNIFTEYVYIYLGLLYCTCFFLTVVMLGGINGFNSFFLNSDIL